MTRFMKKELDVLDRFQKKMDGFGLKVRRSTTGSYSKEMKYYHIVEMTELMDVKGNKKLIDLLRTTGHTIRKMMVEDKNGKKYMFYVSEMETIELDDKDGEEYQEQPEATAVEHHVEDVDNFAETEEIAPETEMDAEGILRRIEKEAKMEAMKAAGRINDQAIKKDILRNHVNYGAMTQALSTLEKMGHKANHATWDDNGLIVCEWITVDGVKIYSKPKIEEKHVWPKPFRPVVGETYTNHGGGHFRCLWVPDEGDSCQGARMINVKSGWEFMAIGITIYPNGTIEWGYSNGGKFNEKALEGMT